VVTPARWKIKVPPCKLPPEVTHLAGSQKEIKMIDGVKKWYQSKIFWAALVAILLGIVPLFLEFFKVVMPNYEVTIVAVATLINGILTML
jgi:hypothetical protein